MTSHEDLLRARLFVIESDVVETMAAKGQVRMNDEGEKVFSLPDWAPDEGNITFAVAFGPHEGSNFWANVRYAVTQRSRRNALCVQLNTRLHVLDGTAEEFIKTPDAAQQVTIACWADLRRAAQLTAHGIGWNWRMGAVHPQLRDKLTETASSNEEGRDSTPEH